ncbi:MAG: MotA/TolQ/ExbB proton channel family protein, partial [Candidatus Brocadia sp.]
MQNACADPFSIRLKGMKEKYFKHIRNFPCAGMSLSRRFGIRLGPRVKAAFFSCMLILTIVYIWHTGVFASFSEDVSLIHIFRKGGPIMWPLLFASNLALGTVIERVVFLVNEQRKRDPQAIEKYLAAIREGDMGSAIRISKTSEFYVMRVLGYALMHNGRALESALLYALELELKRFRRGIPILDTVITLAPLLGLLGTVTGMMGSFSLIGGELSAPGTITGGIAEALIATAFGLGIAIMSLIPFNILNNRVEKVKYE